MLRRKGPSEAGGLYLSASVARALITSSGDAELGIIALKDGLTRLVIRNHKEFIRKLCCKLICGA